MKQKLRFIFLISLLTIALFTQQDAAYANDARVIKDAKKVWTIEFNLPVNENSINEGSIKVTNSKSESIEVDVKVKDEALIQVIPVNEYIQNEDYMLTITKNVESKSGKALKEAVTLVFMLDDVEPMSCDTNSNEIVNIPDENLEKLIRNMLQNPVGDITAADMCSITMINNNNHSGDRNLIKNLSGIEYAKNLKELYLDYNQLNDISSLSGLSNLETLHLTGNQLNDINSLSRLTNLKILHLDENQLSNISALSELANLESLTLEYNQLSNIGVLSELSNLKGLTLGYNQLSDISVLSELTNLERLTLGYNQLSDISVLSELTNLESLILDGNRLSNISTLSGLSNLETLFLSDNQLSDISVLKELTNLKSLNLSHNELNDISVLSGLTNLIYIILDGNNLDSESQTIVENFRESGVDVII